MNIKAIEDYASQATAYYAGVEEYYKKLTFMEAVKQAASAIVPSGISSCTDGKTSFAGHQRRVGKAKCKEGAEKLLTHPYWEELEKAQSFEDIFEVTEKVKYAVYRLGDLWSYDTAQRIALNKGLYPKCVYLQSGALLGARQLAKKGLIESSVLREKKVVPRDIFPEILAKQPSYIIENLLCVGHNSKRNWF